MDGRDQSSLPNVTKYTSRLTIDEELFEVKKAKAAMWQSITMEAKVVVRVGRVPQVKTIDKWLVRTLGLCQIQ